MRTLVAWFCMIVAVAFCSAQEANTQVKVTVDGYAYMGDTDTIQAAKERAMKDAERKAIEQGTSLYIESYSKVHNYMTVEDDIKSMATGYLINKKVLIDALESNPPRYHVQIEAEVKCGDLEQLTKADKEETQSPSKPFSLDFTVLYQAKNAEGAYIQKELTDESVVHVGDRMSLQLQPTTNCNIIAVLGGNKKAIKRLLPQSGTEAYQAQANKKITVPLQQPWVTFDSTDIGTITLLLFASQHSLKQAQWLLEKLENADTEMNAQAFKNFVQNVQKRQLVSRRPVLSNRSSRRSNRATETLNGQGVLLKSMRLQVQP